MFRFSCALLPALVSPVLAGSIIRVPSEAQTIQIAILKSQPFDTIIVAPGTYSEAINFMGRVIIIQSENPNDPATVASTIIDAGGLGTVATFAGTEGDVHSAIDGLTITGGTNGIAGNGTTASIRNCVIRDNSSNGILNADGEISNCEVRDNGTWGLSSCDGIIRSSTITRNAGGLSNCDGTIIECAVTHSTSPSMSGVQSCDRTFLRCLISNNRANGATDSNANFSQCVVSGNTGAGFLRCRGSLIDNTVVAGNKSHGFNQCSIDVLNNTVTGNTGFGFQSHTGEIKHVLLWSNTMGALSSSSTPILSGTANPFFTQPGFWDTINNVWIDGDYHLTSDSPFIDAGDPNYGPEEPLQDLDGNWRIVGARIDLGAYEFQAACEGADFDDDGLADICDSDIDNDGVSNTLDACDFTPPGVPVDENGRPHADLNLDCQVNLADYAVFQLSFG